MELFLPIVPAERRVRLYVLKFNTPTFVSISILVTYLVDHSNFGLPVLPADSRSLFFPGGLSVVLFFYSR